MENRMEEITNSVLEVILASDKYITSNEIAVLLSIAEDNVIKEISRIRGYDTLFLDIHENVPNGGLLIVRVPEWIRDEVRKFLDNGGFASLQKQESERQEIAVQQVKLKVHDESQPRAESKQTKRILKAAGLLALATILIKKSHTLFRSKS